MDRASSRGLEVKFSINCYSRNFKDSSSSIHPPQRLEFFKDLDGR